ncbi:PIG-L family deacetylase [Aureitalea marina]|uniref:GlcNAc-PI de-N-acetylase n=1 Tax=Aureitalea marina TaxID=930804 RepID=A0A2S7KS28_9FLAO|nr:PIG-L family deacetylase [Aureitalea marina]PQB05378.1 hypothetical protein BST85_11130 [Aureitalea marina]
MFRTYRAVLVLFIASFTMQAQMTDVYVSAHPDDWQLFMNPNAYHSLKKDQHKVIFLHTTAGDAGAGTGENNYYLAREEGSLRAIRLMVNTLVGSNTLGTELNETSVSYYGHPIKRMEYGNAVIYFLRLPDGNYYGPGYPVHDNKSLQKLLKGEISNIQTVDQSTSYKDFRDLSMTITELLQKERSVGDTLRLNIAETDTLVNPGDHSDHRYSSYLMQGLAKDAGVQFIRFYIEYHTNTLPMNVFPEDYLISAGVWGATASGLSDMEHNSTWDSVHNSWIGRQYFREEELSPE